ncbi:unnamed protein product, partial [Effrenium voratum]
MIFLAFAPTVLINIFSVLFHFKSQVWVQLQLQTWYWFFLVFFVILVTVIGQGFTQFVSKLADDPLSFPLLLADKMPASTHYYLNFLGLQWVTHAMNLTRYIQCMKFVGLSKIWNDDDARALAEPEDQDYYGMGSRTARFTTNMMVAIIFGTISPLMSFLAWVNFFLCRVFYGYLMIWAESKKQDSGGYFFVAQLHHVFVGLLTYALLMTGMMLRRAPDYVPAGMSILGLVYAVVAYNSFRNDFEWEVLPWEEISQDADGKDFVPEDSGEKCAQMGLRAWNKSQAILECQSFATILALIWLASVLSAESSALAVVSIDPPCQVKDSKNPEETAKAGGIAVTISLLQFESRFQVMKEQVAKHVSSCLGTEGKANFFVQVKSLGGEKKTDDMLAKVNSLLKGTALVDSIKADLQKRGKPDHTLGVTYTSKVEKKIAPKPHLAFDMIIQVSKSADMGGNGNEEELSPEVHAALKKAFLSLADVPDKEKFDMAFKKIRNSAMPNAEVPEGDELVRVAGNITLPRGKEGSKEILAAKLKSGTVAKQINKHMQKEVLKSENNPDARIVGGKKDYKVYSVDFSGMSKMPHGLPSVDTNLVPTTTTSHGLHASKEEILKTWLSMTTTSTTLARIEGPALIRTAAGLCLMATPGRQLGLRPQIASCDRADGHQGWFYSRVAKTVQSVFGLCLAADLNGPAQSPGWQLDTSAQVLQSWVAQRGEGPVNQWACNGHWQQQFSYEPATGQFQILGSSMPGLCLEAKQADMMVALCNPSSFAQQFWLEKVPASSFMPSHINKAQEAPIFMKPYFDGEVAMKSADNTYDSFTLSPFARKRAAFYLTQGCSPVPTYSCGT